MSVFIDKHNRRKSPIALAAFGAALLYMVLFGVLYGLLAEPLYYAVSLGTPTATTVVHTSIIAVIGTAICCLLFLLKDKRVAPYGFFGLAVALCMFYAAALLLEDDARSLMLYLITIYGLAPVLVGNAVTWPIYLKIKRDNPALNHRKTISEELRDAVEKEAAKKQRSASKKASRQTEEPASAPEARPSQAAKSASVPKERPEPSGDALFGPQADRSPIVSRSAQEEAMLFYEDDDDEEAGND